MPRRFAGSVRLAAWMIAGLALMACGILPVEPSALTPTPVATEAVARHLSGAAGGKQDVLKLPTPTGAPTATPSPQPTPVTVALDVPYTAAPMDVLVRINDWRVGQGLWPLKVNADLTRLAQAQADYLATLPDFPDDPHAGPTGENPRQRAADIGWPHYNTPEQVAVDEVAYTGFSPDSAITWWKGSDIHARTITQTAYREIGVAVVDKGKDHIYVADLGSRPGELPVLLDPADSVWYISSEGYRWAAGDRIQKVTRFAFLSDPLAAVLDAAWQTYLPTTAAADLAAVQAVALSDGAHTVIRPVTLATDIAWLSSDAALTNLTLAPSGEALAAGHPADQATQEPAQDAAISAEPANPTLTLVYGDISMTLWHNPPGEPFDISKVALTAPDGGQVLATDFEGPWLGVPLDQFTVGSCLQTWPYSPDQGDPGVVAGCYVRASIVNLKAGGKFWLKGSFDVSNGGVKLRTCPVGPAKCGVILP